MGLNSIGVPELLIILLIILILFGAKKLPDLARSLGKSIGEFKKGKEEGSQMTENSSGKKDEKKSDSQNSS